MLFFAKGVILQYKYRDNSLIMSVTSNLHSVIQYSHTKPYPPSPGSTLFLFVVGLVSPIWQEVLNSIQNKKKTNLALIEEACEISLAKESQVLKITIKKTWRIRSTQSF